MPCAHYLTTLLCTNNTCDPHPRSGEGRFVAKSVCTNCWAWTTTIAATATFLGILGISLSGRTRLFSSIPLHYQINNKKWSVAACRQKGAYMWIVRCYNKPAPPFPSYKKSFMYFYLTQWPTNGIKVVERQPGSIVCPVSITLTILRSRQWKTRK